MTNSVKDIAKELGMEMVADGESLIPAPAAVSNKGKGKAGRPAKAKSSNSKVEKLKAELQAAEIEEAEKEEAKHSVLVQNNMEAALDMVVNNVRVFPEAGEGAGVFQVTEYEIDGTCLNMKVNAPRYGANYAVVGSFKREVCVNLASDKMAVLKGIRAAVMGQV